MTIILSLSQSEGTLWASGPEGLFRLENGNLQAIPQPQQHLYCSVAAGDQLLVGGLPHGIALSPDEGHHWQAAWLDGVDLPSLCLAPDPCLIKTGVILAGTAGAGILRSTDRGQQWTVCNFGLQNFTVLALAWAPPAPAGRWPPWQLVFAATEEGLYRSPNGGLGWRRCTGAEGYLQTLAIASDFHTSGLVLAGAEDAGLWRSIDGGRHFEPVVGAPQQINGLTATAAGWLLSDNRGLWSSADGLTWKARAGSKPALVLLTTKDGIWTGGETGLEFVQLSEKDTDDENYPH